MTPESLSRLNDLRQRIVQADEAQRAGDYERASALMPSDDDIIAALKASRVDRAASMERKATKAESTAASSKFATMSLEEIFS